MSFLRNTLKKSFILFLINFGQFLTLTAQTDTDWSYNKVIYEVNTRQFTESGTFAEFSTHLDRLKELGVGIIWFMPIHPIGEVNRLGTLGSPYSVKDYFAVNPNYGTMDEFKALVDSIHSKGMYVLIDWVGNHTSWDNNLTISHPEWYIHDNNGNFIPPPGTNWTDVIQLDYSNSELRNYMINTLLFWVTETNIDGFRCDAVSFMPESFWLSANVALKNQKPNIFMLAEDDNPIYQSIGFDMSYCWSLHGFGNGVLKRIYLGQTDVNELDDLIESELDNYSNNHYRMYFTSNHDENAWYGTEFEQFGNAAKTFAVLTATFNGMQLIYNGQEVGFNHRLVFFDKDEIIWTENNYTDLYKTLNNFKKEIRHFGMVIKVDFCKEFLQVMITISFLL